MFPSKAGILLAVVLVLSGCQTVVKKEIVTVDKPIPFVPAPPTVPRLSYEVDKLTADDQANPGKVAQAYKVDMLALRRLVDIYQSILDQYASSSVSFDKINAEITQLFSQINKAEEAKVKQIVDGKPSVD